MLSERQIWCRGFAMTKVFSIFGSSSNKQLGPLEQQLLRKLWTHGNATVRELLADGEINLAYTTVMTTVDRLYKKGLLDRASEGRAFRYTPRHTSEELQRVTALESILQLLRSGSPSPLPLSRIVHEVFGKYFSDVSLPFQSKYDIQC